MKNKTLVGLIPFAALLAPALAMAEVNQPQEIIDRPRTTPAGQITVGGDLGYLKLGDLNSTGLNVGGLYGVNDKLEVGAAYAFTLDEFEIKGDIGLHAAYGILTEGNLTVAADLGFGYSVLAEGLDPLTLGAEVQFKVNDKLAVYTPGGQLGITLEGDVKPIALNLPVGVGYQATPQIWAFVDTSIGQIEIADSATVLFGADVIPLGVGGFFSPSNAMDFGARIDFVDLKEVGTDILAITASARLHL